MRRERQGFTLLELLMVIVVISVLMSLLMVAINSVRGTARIAQVRTDVSSLEGALASFRTKFGKAPPSYLKLYTSPAGWNGDPGAKATIRGLWPQFNFNQPNSSYPAAWGTGKILTGAECLTFFLGGIYEDGMMIGFSGNPANPFTAAGDNRVGPFYEFRPDRLVDVDGDGMPEYADPVAPNKAPYLYAAAPYNPGHLVVYTDDITSPTANDLKDVYRHYVANKSNPKALNPQSHQIIAAGPDGLYGRGGMWAEGVSWSIIVQNDPSIPLANKQAITLLRQQETDNVVNFHSGNLGSE